MTERTIVGTRRVPATDADRLDRWARGGDQLATRASIVLLAAEGLRNAEIARRLGVSRQTVGNWRQRYAAAGAEGLRDRPHPGRPSVVDEADIVVRTLLAPADRRSTRALARESGFSHSLVAAVRQRWNLTYDPATPPVVPARPPLPDGEIWVLGLYHDPRRTVLLLGTRPRQCAGEPVASVVEPGTVEAVDAALGAVCRAPAPESRGAASAGLFGPFLAAAGRRHARFGLHAVLLQGDARDRELLERCAAARVTCHQIPARSTWRSFVRAAVGIDCARHLGSSKRVYLDLAAALGRYAAAPGPQREPVRWLRESLPARAEPPTRRAAGRGPAEGGGANQIDLGSFNESVVIEAVRLAGSITRGEISERTRLTQQSVSRIARSLIGRGLLVEDRQRYVTGGKPRTPVRLRDDAAHALGIHIDPEVLTAVVVDLSGRIVAGRSEPITAYARPDALLGQVVGLGERVLAASGQRVGDASFLGIGVATPGPVDTASGTILDPPLMSAWRDVPLLSLLERRFDCPIVIEKDSTAAAIGERWIGRDSRARDFVYLYLGTGVGAGLFLNGDIYRGLTANAGEFGQLCAIALGRVEDDGRPKLLPECNPVASVPALAQRAAPVPPGRTVPGVPGAAYHAACTAAAGGRAAGGRAAAAVRQVAAAIGRGALGMVDLLDVGLVVVGGPFCTDNVAELYLGEIERVVNAFPTARRLRHVVVERSVNGQETAAVGAASTIFHATFTPRLHAAA
jgi:predicted NBD/HSP70 family sugar kinase/transposase